MESLEGHLGGWFTDALGSECSDGLSGLDDAPVDLLDVDVEKEPEL